MKISDYKEIQGFVKSSAQLEDQWSRVSIDSRNLDGFNVFLALKGEKFDGHGFIENVLNSKIKNIILHDQALYEKYSSLHPDVNIILVENTLSFLQDSARFRMSEFKKSGHQTLAITGSNGKTTTKEMLFHVAKSFCENVVCTQGNFNNLIGVPLTIHQEVLESTEFTIIEMGTGKPGDIKVLSEIVCPTYGYITSVGLAHIEFLKDIEGVYKEKTALYENIKSNGETFYVNKYDERLKGLSGMKATIDCEDIAIENSSIEQSYNSENLNNAAFIIGHIYNDFEKAKLEASKFFMPKMNRSQKITLKDKELFLDAYNANPSSMSKAIVSFCERYPLDDSIYVLGDMNELGTSSEEEHNNIALLMNSLGIKNAIFIGNYRVYYSDVFSEDAKCYENVDDFLAEAKNVLNSYKYVFLKASRSLQLEKILDIKDRL